MNLDIFIILVVIIINDTKVWITLKSYKGVKLNLILVQNAHYGLELDLFLSRS